MFAVVQTCDFLGDAEGFASEAHKLAQRCMRVCDNAAEQHALTCALLRLQRQQQHAVLAHLAGLASFNKQLTTLPAILRQPFLQALMQPECLAAQGTQQDRGPSKLLLDAPESCDAFQVGGVSRPLSQSAYVALSTHLPTVPQLRHLSIQRHELDDQQLAVLVAALQVHTQLTCLSIEGNRAGTMTAHSIGAALSCWRHLQQLRITSTSSAGAQDVQQVGDSMQLLTDMRCLHLGTAPQWSCACGAALAALTALCSFEGVAADCVYQALGRLTQLTHLALADVGPEDLADASCPLAKALFELTKLQWLSLSCAECATMCGLPGVQLASLRHLTLAGFGKDAEVDTEDIPVIPSAQTISAPEPGHAHGLRSIASLQHLSYLCLGGERCNASIGFVHQLGIVIASLPALQHFHQLLSHRWYEVGGYQHMWTAWKHTRSLTSLSLKVASERFMAPTCYACQLLELDMSVCCDADTAERYAESLACMTQLTKVTLGGDLLLMVGVDEFITPENAAADTALLGTCSRLASLLELKFHDAVLYACTDIFTDMWASLSVLRQLSLHSCVIPDSMLWLQALREVQSLQQLSLLKCVDTGINELRVMSLLQAIDQNSGVTVLETDAAYGWDIGLFLSKFLASDIKLLKWVGAPESLCDGDVQAEVADFNKKWEAHKHIKLAVGHL